MKELTPVICEETEFMKHGDIFTIDSNSEGLRVPKLFNEGRHYIAVPYNYESRSLRKIWTNIIADKSKSLT